MLWYYISNGKQAGPVEEDQFLQMIRDGKINPADKAWNSSMGDTWASIDSIPGLAPEKSGKLTMAVSRAPSEETITKKADTENIVPALPGSRARAHQENDAPGMSFAKAAKVLAVCILLAAFAGYSYKHPEFLKNFQGYPSEKRRYARELIHEQLKLVSLYYVTPDSSSLYLKGQITNKGNRGLSKVDIHCHAVAEETGELLIDETIDIGALEAGERKQIKKRVGRGAARFWWDTDIVYIDFADEKDKTEK